MFVLLKRAIVLSALTTTLNALAVTPKLPQGTQESFKLMSRMASVNAIFAGRSQAELDRLFTIRDAKGNLRHVGKSAEETPIWALKDPVLDGLEGTSTERAYKELKIQEPAAPVLVAVIDSGVDIRHDALKNKIAVNEAELNGKPGVDDDGNGYVDDVYGWNFLGNANGQNVTDTTLEVTRLYAKLSKKEKEGTLTEAEKALYAEVKEDFEAGKQEAETGLANYTRYQEAYLSALGVLKKAGLQNESLDEVKAIDAKGDATVAQAKSLVTNFLSQGVDSKRLASAVAYFTSGVKFNYNPDFDPSAVVGDHPDQMDEKGYGNPDVTTSTADHGTHVSGIIAAEEKLPGMVGQARYAKILPVRAVPNGDERDKDIANAVRYAVDRGARVINMSFGKAYSPNKDVVDAAFRYAEEKGVVVVHSAGNDGKDTSDNKNFPNRVMAKDGAVLSNWLEVAASASKKDKSLAAEFTNYSKTQVDLFAPGVDIVSSTPNQQYESFSGTSMAGPEVAGVAALLLSQRPDLKPAEVRDIILRSVRKYDGLKVTRPGGTDEVDFASLTATGGVLDAYAALKSIGL